MKKLRLCFVVESGTDVRMVEGLAEHFDLTIFARQIPGGVEISHPPSCTIPIAVGSPSQMKFGLQICHYLWKQRNNIDCVLVQGYGFAALAANLLSRKTGILTLMLICSPTESYYYCRKLFSSQGKAFRYYEYWGIKFVARLNALIGQHYIVLSQYLKNVVLGHGTRLPVHIIPIYGIDVKRFSPPELSKQELKQKMGLPNHGLLIFFSSRIAPEKDSETLLAAFRQLLDEGENLWMLHRSGGYQLFMQSAEHYGVAHRVIATNAVHPHQHLPQDYQACDLCIQASREEGLGFSVLEALSCELPVIAAAVGGLQETIINNETGWTYQVGNADALAACIKTFLNNYSQGKEMAERGREKVNLNYRRELVFMHFTELIQSLKP